MIKIDKYLLELENTQEDKRLLADKAYQIKLFETALARYDNADYTVLKDAYKAGAPLTGEQGLRKKLGAIDLNYFGRAYLPHYFERQSPDFHLELDNLWKTGVMKGLNPLTHQSAIAKSDGCRKGIAAPRGHAKSTNLTFKDTLHAVVYAYKHYPIILSDSSEQAEGFLSDLKTELEDNPIIREDFGKLKGDKVWKSSVILTSTNIKVEALGSGKKIRGRRHQNWRPDLILGDDIENDENVNTPEQRKKLANWYYKAVSKAGDTYTDIIYIGTILHYDSLLSKVLKNPQYDSVVYRGVLSFSESELWHEWERIYTNLNNETRKEDALAFYKANVDEMLSGACVLWPAKWSYYNLMIVKVAEGDASFNSEIQNEPIDPESATFNEEWFDFYDEDEIDFADSRFVLIAANDPSLGKNKKSDTSSIIAIAKDVITGYLFVVEASIERRKPDVIIDDAIEMSKRFKRDYKKPFYKFGVEVVQFQHFFAGVMAQKSVEAGEYLPIEEINSLQNKQLRIESLQPLIKNKYIKFNPRHKTLLQQLKEYPMGKNDDGPDGLEMAIRLALGLKVSLKTKYTSVLRRGLKFKKGAY